MALKAAGHRRALDTYYDFESLGSESLKSSLILLTKLLEGGASLSQVHQLEKWMQKELDASNATALTE
jgi:hypothetical protein